MKKKISLLILLVIWGSLTAVSWFGPKGELSESERRPLAQFPQISGKTILSGKFMSDFEDFSLDQFPLRDTFRSIKSLFHYNVLQQSDNNGIYLSQGHAVQQQYPLNGDSVNHALDRFSQIYDKYLQDSQVYMAIIPDKGYYLAESAGQLKLDYDTMFQAFRQGMPWATHIDLTQVLSAQDYYRTDTHWRQEALLPAAQQLCEAMGVSMGEFTQTTLDAPFYGVYYGQAALPMEPDAITILENEILSGCTVYDYESGKTRGIYDLDRLTGKDPYEVFLSGPRSLLQITNPNATTDRELILFRDSFGSAMAPLLLQDYSKVTLVDVRYIQIGLLDKYIDFADQDVLFLYSTLVLNNSETIK